MSQLPGLMTGAYYVRAIRPAFKDSHRLLPRMKDRAELRRQVLKLRFFGEDSQFPNMAVDLNWSWVNALKAYRIGELRIDDPIGGHNNLRVITWHPKDKMPPSWDRSYSPIPHIWVLAVLQKKSDDFTTANILNFKLRQKTAEVRYCESGF